MDREKLKSRILAEPEEFTSYLKELLELGRIEDDIALGISRFILSNGLSNLTDKQWYTFLEKGLIEYNYVEECERCLINLPWSEMSGAVYLYEDEYCSYCRHMEEKIKYS
ncbi:hypothetical protein [Viridibacillus arvi]|uniref:hypothetical protein n=1 Tax=Viridibacillus arvi TaxID=263475 RepID=UPI0034CEDDDF